MGNNRRHFSHLEAHGSESPCVILDHLLPDDIYQALRNRHLMHGLENSLGKCDSLFPEKKGGSTLHQCDSERIHLLPGIVKHPGQVQRVIGKNAVGIAVENEKRLKVASSQEFKNLVNEGDAILVPEHIREIYFNRPEGFIEGICDPLRIVEVVIDLGPGDLNGNGIRGDSRFFLPRGKLSPGHPLAHSRALCSLLPSGRHTG